MTEGIALAVEGLGKRYRRKVALRDCSFELPAGRVSALVGMNGAGKTTLLSVLAGLLPPTEGRVRLPAGERRIAFVAQEKPLYRHFSVRDMLRLGSKLNTVWDQQRALDWLARFDVPLDRPCGKLSGGQQAQVSFAVAIGSRPSVLLLDEPLSNLDPLARREVVKELLSAVVDTDMTVLMSTHVVAELSGVADHLLLLGDGELVLSGDVDDLLAAHRNYAGPRSERPPVPGEVLVASHVGGQSTFLMESFEPVAAPWTARPVTLEDLVLARLENARAVAA
ncbi:ABC transporter ATP-binding protein [Kutzneria buriramensis]|uniref:ABC-2 type transport system ATP-binding protein n=1 Tax=Kutzneria buriramensis TaxID=1045776 RepID=A0A3E0IAM7_9PSEU|nr:ABC transporter ATP-binding protein [Kutzneria buriramensis]REH55772.1 ABC-2 type transport system ATP-binding protein [Kutzneria buriramensis]